MHKHTTPKKKRKPSESVRGLGRLYKRAGGKEYAPDSPVNAPYWIGYSLPAVNGGEGKRIRQPLRDRDGKSITDRKKAETERRRILAPLKLGSRVESLRLIKAQLSAAEIDRDEATRNAAPGIRIKRGWRAYMAERDRPDSGTRTLSNYEGHYSAFVKWLSATHADLGTLDQFTPEIAGEYADSLLARKVSPNTFNKHINFLKLFFRVFVESGKLAANPFEKIKRRKLKTNSRRSLTVEELVSILSTAPTLSDEKLQAEMPLLLGIGAFTGLRLGDAATLRWREVDLVRRLILRIPNKIRDRRDGPKPVKIGIHNDLHRALSDIPNRKRRGNVLPYTAALYDDLSTRSSITRAIQSHFENCGIRLYRDGTGFEAGKNGKRQHTGKRAVVEVGYHSLRHTWVTFQAEAGTSAALVQKAVGHRNPAMTLHYTDTTEAAALDMAKALPSFTGQMQNEPDHEPLPPWALDLVRDMTAKNWRKTKDELLKGANFERGHNVHPLRER